MEGRTHHDAHTRSRASPHPRYVRRDYEAYSPGRRYRMPPLMYLLVTRDAPHQPTPRTRRSRPPRPRAHPLRDHNHPAMLMHPTRRLDPPRHRTPRGTVDRGARPLAYAHHDRGVACSTWVRNSRRERRSQRATVPSRRGRKPNRRNRRGRRHHCQRRHPAPLVGHHGPHHATLRRIQARLCARLVRPPPTPGDQRTSPPRRCRRSRSKGGYGRDT